MKIKDEEMNIHLPEIGALKTTINSYGLLNYMNSKIACLNKLSFLKYFKIKILTY